VARDVLSLDEEGGVKLLGSNEFNDAANGATGSQL
jgi:hypothetical protein